MKEIRIHGRGGEVGLAQHRSECGLCDLGCSGEHVLDFDHRLLRINDPVIGDCRHARWHVVARDDVLGRDLERDCPQADPDHSVDRPENEDQSWSHRFRQKAAEPEAHAAFVFLEDVDRAP